MTGRLLLQTLQPIYYQVYSFNMEAFDIELTAEDQKRIAPDNVMSPLLVLVHVRNTTDYALFRPLAV
jgi:hypothetical protein